MTSMTHFSSVSIADFEQVNVSWDVSEKPDLLPNNFEISRNSYYFARHYLIVMEFPRKLQDKKNFSTKEYPLIKKNQSLHTKQTIYFLVTQSKNFGTFLLSKGYKNKLVVTTKEMNQKKHLRKSFFQKSNNFRQEKIFLCFKTLSLLITTNRNLSLKRLSFLKKQKLKN